mgnify:CR=1 FL=1|jgi:SH3-like domain-containing protein
METKYGFKKLSLPEFGQWLKGLRVSRTVLTIQQHHTYIPSYILFTGNNHFERQKAMRDHHIHANGWADIGQHFTIFPDGYILTGRSIEKSPACIYGQNSNAVCIENFGNFDLGGDAMTEAQAKSIVAVTASLCVKFNIPVSTDYIVYHHWFDLSTGARNNGTKNNKSCPGTNFFGGNKVADCRRNFLPLVDNELPGTIKTGIPKEMRYVCVNASTLNVRVLPDSSSSKAPERPSVQLGAILRVYDEKEGWLKISNSDSRWVSARYTTEVQRAVVNTTALNVRTGPDTSYPKTSSLFEGDVVFISETRGNWCKIALEDKWVSGVYLTVSS